MRGKGRNRVVLNIDKNSKNSDRVVLDKDIDINKKLLNNPNSYYYDIDYTKQNKNLDKYLDKKIKIVYVI